MAKWPWRSRSMTPIFNTSRNIPISTFGAHLVILAQIYHRSFHRQAIFPIILSRKGQNDLEGQDQWPPFSIPAKSVTGCIFGANLTILAQINDKLWSGQTKVQRIRRQNGQNDPKGHGQWPPFSIPTKSIPWCTFGTNLVISTQSCDKVKFTGRQTDGQTQAMTITVRPESLRGKNGEETCLSGQCFTKLCKKMMQAEEAALGNG